MKNLIEKIWLGDLDPFEHLGRNYPQIRKLESAMLDSSIQFRENLDKGSKKIFDEYNDLMNDYLFAMTKQSFYDGFCLGTKISSEAHIGVEKII